MISTVGDLKKALADLNDEDEVVLMVRNERQRYPNVTQVVGYDSDWGPVFLYTHGAPRDGDEPLQVYTVIGERPYTGNEDIAKRRGDHISVEDVRAMTQLDPKPWVYTDPVSEKSTRLKEPRLDVVTEFKPRHGFEQRQEAYR